MSAVSGARVCFSLVRSTAKCRCLFSRRHAASTRACAVRCMRFLAYFLRFRCLNVTTLFNIDVKIHFRAVATASCSAAILRCCCGHVSCSTRVPGIFQSTFSREHVNTVEFQRVNSRLCVAMMVFAPIYVAQM